MQNCQILLTAQRHQVTDIDDSKVSNKSASVGTKWSRPHKSNWNFSSSPCKNFEIQNADCNIASTSKCHLPGLLGQLLDKPGQNLTPHPLVMGLSTEMRNVISQHVIGTCKVCKFMRQHLSLNNNNILMKIGVLLLSSVAFSQKA